MATGGFVLMASSAMAQAPVTFASFTYNGTGSPFVFINNGSSSKFGTYDSSGNLIAVLVNFNFNTTNAYDTARGSATGTTIVGMLSFSSVVDGTSSNGTFPDQALKDVDITINTLSTDAYAPSHNLLTVTSTDTDGVTGDLNGRKNGSTANISQTDNASSNSESGIVGYRSDFINFAANDGSYTDKDYSVSLTAITPSYSVNANGYTNSFTSVASGNFASNPAPAAQFTPTPASPADISMGMGVMMMGAQWYRKRRKSRMIVAGNAA
jgi:hypothetical protein